MTRYSLILFIALICNAQVLKINGPTVMTGPINLQSPRFSLLQDLEAYWPLEEASGTRNDSVGSSHLTDNNTVTQTTGKVGNCAVFTKASSESLSIADNAAVSTTLNQSFTFAGWVYLSSITTGDTLIGKITGINFEYRLWINNSKLTLYASTDGSAHDGAGENTTTLDVDTWYFFVAWYDASDNKFYMSIDNDTDYSFIADTDGNLDGGGLFALGNHSGNFFDGRLDEVGLWKRILAADERTYLYNSGNGRTYPFN